MTAEQDEVIPAMHGKHLLGLARTLKFDARHVSVPAALHHEVMSRNEGRVAVKSFLQDLARMPLEDKTL